MPYIIDNRAGQTIVIPDGALNQDFSIDLVGRNYENYGAVIARSFVDLLDNFASSTSPSKQTNGQLWYDTAKSVLRVYDNTVGLWKPLLPIVTEVSNPPGENAIGTTYFDKQIGKFFINDGTAFRMVGLAGEVNSSYNTEVVLGGPAEYGSRLKNIFLEDTTGVPRAVTAICLVNNTGGVGYTNGEKIIAILSGHDEFEIANTASQTEGETVNYYAQLADADSIGTTIRPGLNLRADNDSEVERSQQAYRADVAYNLNIGSYGADNAANIAAANVYHNQASVNPTKSWQQLGNSTNKWAEVHTGDVFVGGVQPENYVGKAAGSWASLGYSGQAFNEAHIEDLYLSGSIFIEANGLDLGNSSSRLNTVYANAVNTLELTVDGYSFPTSAGTRGQQLFIDNGGQLFWRDPVSSIANINARGGTVSANTITTVDGVDETTFIIDIGGGTGITVFDDEIAVDLSDFDTDSLAEGSSNLYFTNARARAAISHNDVSGYGSLTYSSTTGVITYVGPSASEVRSAFSAGNGISISSGSIAAKESEIDHNSLKNYSANRHIDHSSVSITAGAGLSGGGNLTQSRTLDVQAANGVKISGDKVVLDVGYARTNVYSSGTGISIDQNGVISNTGVVTGIDTSGFVTLAGTQTIGGSKTFSSRTTFSSGLQFGSTNNEIVYTGNMGFLQSGDSNNNFVFSSSGDFTATGDITAYSDLRVKKNIEPITDALNKVDQLNGVTFERSDQKNNTRHAGLIAQDLQKVLPEVVQENDDGILSVAYGNTVGLLVEAIKELRAEVAQLKQELSGNGSK